ncbi:MAG: hypothetical protein WDZ37_05405 [Solirubrobacterales bacterium]
MFKLLGMTVVAALAIAAAVPSVLAKPVEQVSFTAKYTSKNRSKATGTLSLRTQFTIKDDVGGQLAPATRILLRFPKGASTNGKGFPTCDAQKILDTIGKGCPKGSALGTGTASASAQPIVANVNADVTLFNGKPSGGAQTIVVFAVPELGPNLALPSQLKKGSGPYGYVLDNAIPSIQTLPGAPNAALTGFDATVGAKPFKKGGKRIHYITGPLVCNGTFFLLDGEFSYEGGITNTVYERFTLNGGPRCP